MNTERNTSHSRFSLRKELFLSFFVVFLLFTVGLFAILIPIYSQNVETEYLNQVTSTCQQALSNYTNYASQVVNVSDGIQKKLNNESSSSIKNNAGKFFDQVMLVSPSISSISLYDEVGNSIGADSMYVNSLSPEEVKKEDWFRAAIDSPMVNNFSRIDSASFFTLSKEFDYDNGTRKAILKMVYDFSDLEAMIDKARLGKDGHVYIFDNGNNLVFSSGVVTDEESRIIQETILGTANYNEEGSSYFLYISTIPKTRWRISIKTNINSLYESKNKFFIISIALSIAITGIFLAIFYLISVQISKPLVRLQREMENVESLDFKMADHNDSYGTEEIVSLSNSYRKMMMKIHNLAEEVINEQKEMNKAELKALQNQINPHFLYNTLDSIIYMIDENENEKAEKMIVSLSRFFRISISRGHNIIPVKDEIAHVRYYLEIQKMRFGESFTYQISASDEILDLPIIKLILQPIVENAIVHGFGETTKREAIISIKGYIEDSFLKFDIADNGFGMLEEKVEEVRRTFKDKNAHNGVGISNVYQRIRIYYGEKADIRIESSLDIGTTIEIIIPLSEVKNHEE